MHPRPNKRARKTLARDTLARDTTEPSPKLVAAHENLVHTTRALAQRSAANGLALANFATMFLSVGDAINVFWRLNKRTASAYGGTTRANRMYLEPGWVRVEHVEMNVFDPMVLSMLHARYLRSFGATLRLGQLPQPSARRDEYVLRTTLMMFRPGFTLDLRGVHGSDLWGPAQSGLTRLAAGLFQNAHVGALVLAIDTFVRAGDVVAAAFECR